MQYLRKQNLNLVNHPPTPSKQSQELEKRYLPYNGKHLTDHLPTSIYLLT